MAEDKDNPITRIARQAEEIFREKGLRWDTYFYKVVLAGNVKAIKQVVAHLEDKDSTETLDWLFKRNKFEEMDHMKKKTSKRLTGIRAAIFILLSLVNLIATPFFYGLHMLSTSLLNRKQRRISTSIQLPLAYAAFSQKQEMVSFFLSQGADIDHIDQYGNNIFHYISDLSAESPDTAILIFQNTVKAIDDHDTVKMLLEQERNSGGFTAVEYAAKFGSPSLLSEIFKQPNIMHRTPFLASADEVKFMEEDDHGEASIDASTKVEVVDVSRYEAGRLTDQSTLLNILSDWNIACMSRTDLQIFSDVQFIGRWLILKCKQMLYAVMVLHVFDVLLTGFMMYVLSTSVLGRTGVALGTWKHAGYVKAELDEYSAWARNDSVLFKKNAFDKLVKKNGLMNQLLWFGLLHPDTALDLLNASSLDSDIELALKNFNMGGRYIISIDQLSDTMDTLYEHAMKMPQLSNATTDLFLARSLPQIIVGFAKAILPRKHELTTEATQTEFFQNFSMKIDNKTITPYPSVDFRDISSLLCPSHVNFVKEDLNTLPSSITSEDLRTMSCDGCELRQIVNIIENHTCKVTDPNTLLQMCIYEDQARPLHYIKLFVVSCAFLYIILDIVERGIFLTKSVMYQTRPHDMLKSALGQKVPGSYIRKQLNIFSCLAIVTEFYFDKFLHKFSFYANNEHGLNTYFANESLIAMVFIVAMVVRFLMHIHSLRLLPGIGHFVITTFMMGTNLLHFSAVFGIVLFIFAALFHILIDDPNCPLEKSQGFVTMHDSLFSTFKLTFAHGNLDPFFSSAPVQLTYVLYVIIVGLLLLNLIIAIMSTTATEIMANPWKEVLWKVEWLDEATSAEYTISVLTLPFRKLRGFGYFSHKKAGYTVKKYPENKYKILIEHFQCAALQNQQQD